MNLKAYTLILSSLFSSTLWAQSCDPSQDRDNRSPTFYNEQTQSHIMRDQGDSGWCYAFSTADLVTDYVFKNNREVLNQAPNRNDQLISPVSLLPAIASLGSGEQDEGIRFSEYTAGGQVTQVMIDIVASVNPRERVCLEDEVRSSNFNLASEEVNILNLLDEVERNYNLQATSQEICLQASRLSQTVLPNINANDIETILTQLNASNKPVRSTTYISSLIQTSCKNPLPRLELPEVKRVRRTMLDESDNSQEFLSTIDSQLMANSIVALEYNGLLLETEDSVDSKGFPIEAPHVSTIVGRRCHNGENQYLIRNSYGNDCSFYLESLQCDQGNIWVSQELLLRMSRRISYL
ncbi:MAG: hypothetical protein CME71_03040 [Halobacteriovorax sp.]|nr:hypothetical protein [Halobacteriovorax sp.]|tara:strand:+ start:286 stop:1338 length:1053 start_codon:yes stop_codon:yes gene_type:complete